MKKPNKGRKRRTIEKILGGVFNAFLKSIDDEEVKKLVEQNTIITGGAIASMLIGDKVNDYDLYFTNKETVVAIAKYFVNKVVKEEKEIIEVRVADDGRVSLYIPSSGKVVAKEKGKYSPIYMSSNAITLSNDIQIVLRFYGDADEIHANYDFVHCTNYWTSKDRKLVLRQAALESLLSRDLKYQGSKYPLCSVMRIRKFIKRGWTVNAGQVLKMLFQVSQLDLTNVDVLEDQLTGVDSAYFESMIASLRSSDSESVDLGYAIQLIEEIFG